MSFLLVALFLSLLSVPSVFSFSFILLGFWLYYQFDCCMYMNSPMEFSLMSDELSLFMTYMMTFVLFISFVYSLYLKAGLKLTVVFMSMLIFCFGVFTTNNLFMLYFYYESSLLPILYIIIKWGSYPERSLSALMLLIYTSIFTFPFILVMFTTYSIYGTFLFSNNFTCCSAPMGALASFIVFCTFAVKLPVYGLHFWLPMAHVEAPTFGSMILAGVLLKLGGVGLIRCINYVDMVFMKSSMLSYLLVFMLYVTVVCTFQSDFKRLVAYSSVSHMMAIPLLYLANTAISMKSILMLMLFHGLSSPILFMLVGVVYSLYSTRQLIMIRGLVLLSPLTSLLMVLAFFFTMSAPPFPSFVSEVYFLVSCFSLSNVVIVVFILFTFLSMIYNLNWLTAMVFSSASCSTLAFNLTYMNFFPMMVSFLLCVPISLIVVLM
uniref:NADH-ubiquinone oxidoreductase chain 4 n=1 Tax=Brachionus plicatilis TaxID=10195 RepID=B1GYK6_BRAPC|nr:NADH dehydrogenase subunit 4 [Brachionus plicatilis]BAG12881.1 NADH dehydrogenase subunit 4 [Brachionus plicatilis]